MIYLKLTLSLIAVLFLFSLTASGAQSVRQPDSTAPVKTMRMYVVNGGSSGGITVCDIEKLNGGIENCQSIINSAIKSPSDITFNPKNDMAYIPDSDNNTLSICSVDPVDGLLTNCKANTPLKLSRPFNITFNIKGTVAYITNSGIGQLAICSVAAGTGMITDCTVTSFLQNLNLKGVTLNHQENKVYLTSDTNETVSICDTVPALKEVSNCLTSNNPFLKYPQYLTLSPSDKVAYIPQNIGGNSITLCAINGTTGLFNSCQLDSSPTFDGASFVAFNKTGRLAYISNSLSNSVSVCHLLPFKGLLENCRLYSQAAMQDPQRISFHAS